MATTVTTSAGPYHPVDGYLIIANPTLGGVSRWQCMVEFTGQEPVVQQWDLYGDATNLRDPGDDILFDVSVGVGDQALRPSYGVILLAYWYGVLAEGELASYIDILPLPGSDLFAGAPGYVDGDDPGLTAKCEIVTNIFAWGHSAAINPPDFTDGWNSSWGEIKSLFR